MDKESLLSHWRDKISDNVLKSFSSTPREEFLPHESKPRAYEDTPLPILRNKTISQPSTVILMTEALDLKKGHKVLEVGAGSGYQAALIAHLVGNGEVVTTEVIPELVAFARENLQRTGTTNVTVLEHDGSQGCEDFAPYDRIIFTAASPHVPLHLLSQLKENGIIVAPVGDLNEQHMIKIIKHKDRIEQQNMGEFVFSPLVGKYGFDEENVM